MDWQIVEHQAGKYLEVITKGIADNDGSLAMAKEINSTMFEKKYLKVLIDHRNISLINSSIVEVYDRPKVLQIIGALFNIKIAEIIKPEYKEHFEILRSASLIHGYKIRIFESKEDALRWLLL